MIKSMMMGFVVVGLVMVGGVGVFRYMDGKPAVTQPAKVSPKKKTRAVTAREAQLRAQAEAEAEEFGKFDFTPVQQKRTSDIAGFEIEAKWVTVIWIVIVLAGLLSIGLYFLPTVLAFHRGKRNSVPILLINFFFGWTLLGWVATLAWALAYEEPQYKPGM